MQEIWPILREFWKNLNSWLNAYGGFISTVSLFFSVVIFVKTGQIKNNIKNMLNHDAYEKRKKEARESLESILESIYKDDIFDRKLVNEIEREVAALEHYSVFFDQNTRKNMKKLRKELDRKTDCLKDKRKGVEKQLSKLIGDLGVTEPYLG